MAADAIIRDIAELVAIPSVSSRLAERDMPNRPVVDWLANRLEPFGFRNAVQQITRAPGKVNLIATLGRGTPGLILSGHTDTVPFDAPLWDGDPFVLREREGRLYGLGTCDMKGFFALVLAALAEVDLRRIRAPLVVLATADEESSMAGAKALVAAGELHGGAALIGEPTGMKPIRLHKGILTERIRVLGQSGHSSDPSLGNNALEGMHRVIAELLAWRTELQARRRDPRFSVPVTTLNLGRIQGGDNPNRICGTCELDIDLRPVPGLVISRLRAELRQRVEAALAGTGLQPQFEMLFEGLEPLETPASSPIVLAAEALTGTESGGVPFATEGPFLAALGADVVVLGPGSLAQAHQPNEYLEANRLRPMVGYISRLIEEFCY